MLAPADPAVIDTTPGVEIAAATPPDEASSAVGGQDRAVVPADKVAHQPTCRENMGLMRFLAAQVHMGRRPMRSR